jgi:hypothetical protein
MTSPRRRPTRSNNTICAMKRASTEPFRLLLSDLPRLEFLVPVTASLDDQLHRLEHALMCKGGTSTNCCAEFRNWSASAFQINADWFPQVNSLVPGFSLTTPRTALLFPIGFVCLGRPSEEVSHLILKFGVFRRIEGLCHVSPVTTRHGQE